MNRKELALAQPEPMACKSDSAFKARCRQMQSDFRKHVLQVPYDPNNRFGKYGAFLCKEDADAGLNFFEGFRPEILQAIAERYPNMTASQHDGLFANMLRSEHIPWNVFFPMKRDLNRAKDVLNEILDSRVEGIVEIDEVLDIRIEWAPDKKLTLDDNTSFDVFVEYRHGNERGGLGIEVKFTEKGYPFGKKEYHEVMENQNSRYAQVTASCPYFIDEVRKSAIKDTILCKDDFRQVWRNHLLGAAMVQNGMSDRFISMTVFPSGNEHFRMVGREYEALLTPQGRYSCQFVSFEKLFVFLTVNYSGTEHHVPWIRYLINRYLVDNERMDFSELINSSD